MPPHGLAPAGVAWAGDCAPLEEPNPNGLRWGVPAADGTAELGALAAEVLGCGWEARNASGVAGCGCEEPGPEAPCMPCEPPILCWMTSPKGLLPAAGVACWVAAAPCEGPNPKGLLLAAGGAC